MYPKKELAQLILSACQFYNIDKVVVSPGSRNAPLTIGLTNLNAVEVFSIVDERCAGFFALGMAQQTQKAVALVCTSGSALLNYYPAIAEAFYSNIPLIVISADRPKHLIDIGDGQTIRQENVYANHILCSSNLIEGGDLEGNKCKIENAISIAKYKKGPVHINVPFDEPLYETVSGLQEFDWKIYQEPLEEKTVINYNDYSSIWNSSKKKMILVGVSYPSDDLQNILQKVGADDSVLVMTETTSNLYGKKYINGIDKLITKLTEEDFEQLQPEVLITFGGMVVSKRIKQFLRKYKPKHHWHIDEYTQLDTYFSLSSFVKEKPSVFLEELYRNIKKSNSDYSKKWVIEAQLRQEKHKEFLKDVEYSDLRVFESIINSLPNNIQLQLSNSSVIRYVQLFDLDNSLQVFCNRGTSGIDGSTTTAIGASFVNKEQTVLITGDLSFFYDSNALWNNYIPKNFRIIVINNSGGGIFKIIPGPKTTNALHNFETKHNLTAEHLAKMYNFEYDAVTNLQDLDNRLSDFYKESNLPKILEIHTPSEINDVVLQQYFKSL